MIGDLASIATLILFVIYFIGRCITIFMEKQIKYEDIDIYDNEKDINVNEKIVEEFKCEDNNLNILIIKPTEKSFRWFRVYKNIYDDENDFIVERQKIYECKNIYNGNAIRIDTELAEIIPQYTIEFQRSDYMIGKVDLSGNWESGVQEELLRIRHTFTSVIYYLFR